MCTLLVLLLYTHARKTCTVFQLWIYSFFFRCVLLLFIFGCMRKLLKKRLGNDTQRHSQPLSMGEENRRRNKRTLKYTLRVYNSLSWRNWTKSSGNSLLLRHRGTVLHLFFVISIAPNLSIYFWKQKRIFLLFSVLMVGPAYTFINFECTRKWTEATWS